jgi:WD40 repeat protein
MAGNTKYCNWLQVNRVGFWREIQNFCNWLQVNRVVYHPTEDTVITGSHDTTVRIWNVPTAQTIQVGGLS